MACDEVFRFADQRVFENTGQRLTDIQREVFLGSFYNQTYGEIAAHSGYDVGYISQIGAELWQQLSKTFKEPITKKRFRTVIKRYWERFREIESPTPPSPPTSSLEQIEGPTPLNSPIYVKEQAAAPTIEYPEGPTPLNSPFYVERASAESLCFQTVLQPGSLLRIKAPRLMGKTSLIMRTLHHAACQGYEQASLSFGEVESKILEDSYEFLRWFCNRVGKQFGLADRLDQYWDTQLMSSISNCTDYFETYLLPELKRPLVLGLDDVNHIFPYINTATNFFRMLRNWHEKGKNHPIWQRIRLVIGHSTEVYIRLNTHHSPFNVGIPIQLPELTKEQVGNLAERYGLNWTEREVETLLTLVGGHPQFVRLAMYYIARHDTTLDQLIHDVATDGGIYSNHLRRHWDNLRKNSDLANVLLNIAASSNPIKVEREQGYKLQSMGLIKWEGDCVAPSCDLYRRYFSK